MADSFNPYDVLFTINGVKIVDMPNVRNFNLSITSDLAKKSRIIDAAVDYSQHPQEHTTLSSFYERSLDSIDFSGHPDLAKEADDIKTLSSAVGWILPAVTDYNQKTQSLAAIGYTLPNVSTLRNADDIQ